MIADGPPRRVLEVIADGGAELLVPEPVLVELSRVLREKLGIDDDAVNAILALLADLAGPGVPVPDEVDAVSGDPDDDRILAAALAAQAGVLVSGDRKHLLPLGQHRSLRTVRPQDFLAELAG